MEDLSEDAQPFAESSAEVPTSTKDSVTDHLPREVAISRDSDVAERAGSEQVTRHVGWTQKSLGILHTSPKRERGVGCLL